MDAEWTGVFPALMTEFKKDGSLDLEGTQRHMQSCIYAGVSGFVMLGTLGENTSLYANEKEAVLRAAVEVSGGLPILSGVAEYTTEMAIEHVRRAEKVGCSGLMVLPCMVYPQDQREAMEHFRGVSTATQLPIMVYNNRVAYNVDLTPESFMKLADVENIIAVKESSHDSRRITDMINFCGTRYSLFCGVDDLVLENVLFGALGWVSGLVNSFPQEAVQLFDLARSGRIKEATNLYRWFMPLLHLDVNVKLVQMIKLTNQIMGEGTEWVRGPRLTLQCEERQAVIDVVEAALKNRPNF